MQFSSFFASSYLNYIRPKTVHQHDNLLDICCCTCLYFHESLRFDTSDLSAGPPHKAVFPVQACLSKSKDEMLRRDILQFEVKELAGKALRATISATTKQSPWWISQNSCSALRTPLNSCGGLPRSRLGLTQCAVTQRFGSLTQEEGHSSRSLCKESAFRTWIQ